MLKKYNSTDLKNFQQLLGYGREDYCSLLGLSVKRYYSLINESPDKILPDDTLVRTLYLYSNFQNALPKGDEFDPKEFYYWLGFKNISEDYRTFAALVGRKPNAVKMSLGEGKSFNKALTNYLRGFHRLDLTPQATLEIMNKVASGVNALQFSK